MLFRSSSSGCTMANHSRRKVADHTSAPAAKIQIRPSIFAHHRIFEPDLFACACRHCTTCTTAPCSCVLYRIQYKHITSGKLSLCTQAHMKIDATPGASGASTETFSQLAETNDDIESGEANMSSSNMLWNGFVSPPPASAQKNPLSGLGHLAHKPVMPGAARAGTAFGAGYVSMLLQQSPFSILRTVLS